MDNQVASHNPDALRRQSLLWEYADVQVLAMSDVGVRAVEARGSVPPVPLFVHYDLPVRRVPGPHSPPPLLPCLITPTHAPHATDDLLLSPPPFYQRKFILRGRALI